MEKLFRFCGGMRQSKYKPAGIANYIVCGTLLTAKIVICLYCYKINIYCVLLETFCYLLPSSDSWGFQLHYAKANLNLFITFVLFYINSCVCISFELHCVHLFHQLKKLDGSHQEATEKEVERILGYLKSYHRADREFKVTRNNSRVVW